MKKLLSIIISVILLVIAFYYYENFTRAEPSATQVSCNDLTGVWQGRYFDQGPYAGEVDVKFMLLVNKDGKVVGKSLATGKKVTFANKTIRGICKNGKLDLYFFHDFPRSICGVVSHAKVIDRHHINLSLAWENAMTGGHGNCQLYMISRRVDTDLASKLHDFDFANTKVNTCH